MFRSDDVLGPIGVWNKMHLWNPLVGFPIFLVSALLVWSLVWKGIGLWKSARHEQKGWFIALLILNTAGVLPILYLAFFQKKGKK